MTTLPLVWFGPLHDPSGYADEGRAFLLSLERADYAVAARPQRWNTFSAGLAGEQLGAVDRAASRRAPEGEFVSVYHLQPAMLPEAPGPRVFRTMFETDRFPAHWHANLLEADELWVPSDFNVETFMRGGVPRSHLHVLPETIDFELFAPGRHEPWPLGGDRSFTFLTNFDFTERKGWDVLLDAWAAAFAPDDDVQLVLKCVALHGDDPDIRGRIDAHLAGRATAPIVLNTDLLPAADMPRLYAAADAYVLPTRGEGWGRPFMEALAMGLPTIGSRWSGCLAFMHDGNSFLVEGDVRPIESWQPLPRALWNGHSWFEPNAESLVAHLQDVARGARKPDARAELLERFGPEPIANRIAELTHGALARAAERRETPVAAVWRGEFGSCHSLAVVNDGHADAIERTGERIVRRGPNALAVDGDAVGIAAHWPPTFDAPTTGGPFVLYQPWEFGRVPQRWVDGIRGNVDEVWVPSEFVRQSYVASGVAPELVQVVPNGVDLERFTPDGPKLALPTTKSTVFLFVGGVIHRKGVDVLLAAYRDAFGPDDDVCLAVKTFGGATVYRGQTADDALRAFANDPAMPELLLLEEDVPFASLPALYRAADVLVQPYRAEGFCLPALEALACGVPVIATAGGPTDDFVGDAGWAISATRMPLDPDVFAGDGLELAGDGFLLEPDVRSLVAAFRTAADPAARADKAARARAAASRFGWDEAAARASARISALQGRIPIRTIAAAVIPHARRVLLHVAADWQNSESWLPAVRAYVDAFDDLDEVTLVLPDGERALEQLEAALASADSVTMPDIALADSGRGPALELAADAVIAVDGVTPLRARRIVPPTVTALRAVVLQEAA